MRTKQGRAVLASMLAVAAGSGCYTSAYTAHRASGNGGCPSRTGPVVVDSVGLGLAGVAAFAPMYVDDPATANLTVGVGVGAGILFGLSLLHGALSNCSVTPEEVAVAADDRHCRDGDAAACYAVAERFDQHSLSDPFAAQAAVMLFGRACELGDRRACRLQGERHRLGSPDEAARYFARACALGDDESCAPAAPRDESGPVLHLRRRRVEGVADRAPRG